MRKPKFVTHYKICGTQLEKLVAIHKHFESLGRYTVSVACVDDDKQLYRVLSYSRGLPDPNDGFRIVEVIGNLVRPVEVQS